MIDNITGSIRTIMLTLSEMTHEEHGVLEDLIWGELEEGEGYTVDTWLKKAIVEASKEQRGGKMPEPEVHLDDDPESSNDPGDVDDMDEPPAGQDDVAAKQPGEGNPAPDQTDDGSGRADTKPGGITPGDPDPTTEPAR
jgi:hypothetical protein